jgi:predicted nucleic acid-binding protein
VVEYEDALMRQVGRGPFKRADVTKMLDSFCAIAHHQSIFFLWRPLLSDPKDDMVLEAAVAAACAAVVTHNVSDFVGGERFGLRIMTPGQFLMHLRGLR